MCECLSISYCKTTTLVSNDHFLNLSSRIIRFALLAIISIIFSSAVTALLNNTYNTSSAITNTENTGFLNIKIFP